MNVILNSKSHVKFILGKRRSGKSEIARELIRRLSKDDRLFIFCGNHYYLENYGPIFPSNVSIKNINDFEKTTRGYSGNASVFIDDIFSCKIDITDLLYKFKSVYIAGSPLADGLSLNLVKRFFEMYDNDISFFEIPGGLLNDTEETVYRTIISWLNDYLKSKISYTKFDIVMEAF